MKVQKTGNWFTLLALFFLYDEAKSTDVSLALFDDAGKSVSSVRLGTPFYADVEVITEDSVTKPHLELDPSLTAISLGSQTNVFSMNGHRKVTKTFRYRIQTQAIGNFVVGPVSIQIGNQEYISNSKTIEVVMGNAEPDAQDKASSVFLKIGTDKKTAYKGEKINFYLRVYMKDESSHIDGIEEPIFQNCTASKLEGPISGMERINGIEYKYLEWKASFYAHETGTLIIPAISAQITMQKNKNYGLNDEIDFLGMVGSILGHRVERKQLYSNALPLKIIDLPETDTKDVIGLGSFSSFTIKSNLDAAQQGEGIVITLELVGQGNFSMISHPPLVLPEHLNCYSSKMESKLLGAGITKKDFEYIVQGSQPGKYIIPAQEFTYFDPEKKKYKTLKTKQLALTIKPSKEAEITEENSTNDDMIMTKENDSAYVLEQSLWNNNGSWFIKKEHFLKIMYTWILLVTLLSCWAWYCNFYKKTASSRLYKQAFAHARRGFLQARKENDDTSFYTIWITLFAVRLKCSINEITEDRIEAALRKHKYPEDVITQWREFFMRLVEIHYVRIHVADKHKLYEQSLYWLGKFEGRL